MYDFKQDILSRQLDVELDDSYNAFANHDSNTATLELEDVPVDCKSTYTLYQKGYEPSPLSNLYVDLFSNKGMFYFTISDLDELGKIINPCYN